MARVSLISKTYDVENTDTEDTIRLFDVPASSWHLACSLQIVKSHGRFGETVTAVYDQTS